MNDRHPSGTAQHAAYDGHSTTSFATDPLFGDLPGDVPYDPSAHDSGSYHSGSYDSGSYGSGSYDTGQWPTQATGDAQPYATSPYPASAYPTTACGTGSYDTGTYDTSTMWATGAAGHDQQHTGQWPAQTYDTQSSEAPAFAAQTFDTQSFDTRTFTPHAFEPHAFEPESFETRSFDAPVFGTTAYDTGAYDATAWNSAGPSAEEDHGTADHTAAHAFVPDQYSPAEHPEAHDASDVPQAPDRATEPDAGHDTGEDPEPGPGPEPVTRAASRRAAQTRTAANRSRRRTPARRSALLTIAVPSVCAVGVAGAAAASVGTFSGDEGTKTQPVAAPDASAVQPSVANNKLDTQLKEMSADAGDFADRASRTQERIDLKAKQEADRKKAAAAAAHKEAMRPKFVLPVKQHGLSAYYGQAGINWMSVHSGIDFPVSYGTEVMAATDGTVRTQWNSAYGNMAIVTAKDGTETWYCHLSSHTVMSGPVKAGDVIAHSGNSGNSTGPHLHFEVRPGGGAAIDPLPWLRAHDLDPT